MKARRLEKINRDNLLQGRDSEGNDMPFYSHTEYGFEKLRRNPKNRGRWDLKNTGQYHQGLYTTITAKQILFKQRVRNAKTRWIDNMMEKANRSPVGITKNQVIDAQVKNKPYVKNHILRIINKS